jgi:dihydrofolate reductase
MPDVIANLSMSLDGFVAYPDDSVGELFDWYAGGPVEVTDFGGRTGRLAEPSASYFRDALARVGCFLVGRRLYDHTGGWGGRPPADAPMVVVTHRAPAEPPPQGGVEIEFATDGIDDAVDRAAAKAGDGIVSVAGAALARSVLDAGRLDEIVVNLVPVILGAGVPFFAGAKGPVRLADPEIVEAPGVTHLRYRVR